MVPGGDGLARWALLSGAFVASGYVLCVWEHYGAPPSILSAFLRDHVNTDHENSFIELFSAVAWGSAAVLFARAAVKHWPAGWLMLSALLCLTAFGEEISWGMHWAGPDRFSGYVNSPWNVHNQSVGGVDLVLYMNPIFYSVLVALWVLLPVAKRRRPLVYCSGIASMPVPSVATRWLLAVDTAAYLALDRIVDVGHVYEASTGMVAVLASLTMRDDDGRSVERT